MGGNLFVRAEALKTIGGYNTAIAFYGDDTDTGNRLVSLGKVIYKNDVVVKSSARRFRQLGALATLWHYIINYIWVIIFKKPFHLDVLE